MVAREGIEPPTPAFSGLRSTTELPGRGRFSGRELCTRVEEKKYKWCFQLSISIPAVSAKPQAVVDTVIACA